MSLRRRSTIAGLAGILGAIIAGIWVYAVTAALQIYPPPNALGITLPAGTISGFLFCFLIYHLYLRIAQPEYSYSSVGLYRAIFGGLAGVLAGTITGIADLLSYGVIPHVWEGAVRLGICGVLLGGPTGIAAGLIFGPVLDRFTRT